MSPAGGLRTLRPASLRLALWYDAWLAGAAAPDDAVAAIAGEGVHHVVGLPDEPEPVPLGLALGLLRRAGATRAALALAVPGDLVGLAGPPELNAAALDAGEAVVVEGAGVALVPRTAGRGTVWTMHQAQTRRPLPDPQEAAVTLRQQLLAAANTLAALDVARWRPEVADELIDLRATRMRYAAPAGLDSAAHALLEQGLRCLRIVDLAGEDDGGAVSAGEAEARRSALLPLARAARRAVVAATLVPRATRDGR